MNQFFLCKNGQNLSWTSICDGYNQCIDGSDEQNCYCQDDIYSCLQGYNVSCKLACTTYGRVTCLFYQNKRACEHYFQKYNTIPINNFSIIMRDFNLFQYFIYLMISILLLISIILIFIYFFRTKIKSFRSNNDFYEPPPYPDSIYYEIIKTSSMSMVNPMPLPEQNQFTNIQTYCV